MSSSADPSQNIIRILRADDRPVVREGLTAILELEEDLNVVGHMTEKRRAGSIDNFLLIL
jgi:DNA-binding NarL/FixJ family response regulator